jgi:hypothetical protein
MQLSRGDENVFSHPENKLSGSAELASFDGSASALSKQFLFHSFYCAKRTNENMTRPEKRGEEERFMNLFRALRSWNIEKNSTSKRKAEAREAIMLVSCTAQLLLSSEFAFECGALAFSSRARLVCLMAASSADTHATSTHFNSVEQRVIPINQLARRGIAGNCKGMKRRFES